MNILIINGSHRKNGATASILKQIQTNLLQNNNMDIEYIDTSLLNMAYCTGCCYCYKHGYCHMNDDLEKSSEKMATCDGLIIGTPTYVSNVSAQIKTIIDRCHFVIEQLLYNKYALSIITYEKVKSKLVCKLPRII